MFNSKLQPIHPGEILRAEYLLPLGLKPYTLAKMLHVHRTRIERIVREETALTPQRTAERRVGKEGVSPCRSRWSQYTSNTTIIRNATYSHHQHVRTP